MFQSNVSSLSTGDRWIVGLMAAGVTFLVGYTLTRVTLAETSATPTTEDVQQSVIPHESALWQDFSN
jgi:hypothetical protein